MADTATIVWGVLFGALGLGYLTYGRRQRALVPLFAGIALMVIPYFIPNAYLLVAVGAMVVAIPYFIRF
jgi:peptidoglycan/LPS O-acetylase OafA/YrhL